MFIQGSFCFDRGAGVIITLKSPVTELMERGHHFSVPDSGASYCQPKPVLYKGSEGSGSNRVHLGLMLMKHSGRQFLPHSTYTVTNTT